MLHDLVMLVSGMYIGLFTAFCVAAFLIYLDHRTREDQKLAEKLAYCAGINIETAKHILNQ